MTEVSKMTLCHYTGTVQLQSGAREGNEEKVTRKSQPEVMRLRRGSDAEVNRKLSARNTTTV